MKTTHLLLSFFLMSISFCFSQNGTNDADFRGPMNTRDAPGIIDGVVIQEEVPVRSAVPYEYVRSADYVWSKRVFSKIDSREKINHELFFPFDYFDYEEDFDFGSDFNATMNSALWTRHNERYSLWTVILKHILMGDLRVYSPFDLESPKAAAGSPIRDGYQFKYPVASIAHLKSSNDGDAFYSDKSYQTRVLEKISNFSLGKSFELIDEYDQAFIITKTNQTFEEIFANPESLKMDLTGDEYTLQEVMDSGDDTPGLILQQKAEFEKAWKYTPVGQELETPPKIYLLGSQSIVGYHIKEDWFFDKERSVLDKRIIGIAPIASYVVENDQGNPTTQANQANIVYVNHKDGKKYNNGAEIGARTTFDTEMFWLYFPQLRDVIVNYFTYNEKSDAQWMSFDDLFWKRKFNAQIYRTSDKFDRNIEDYRFGVDALREAERIKGEIRKWEHDVWNY